MIDELAIIIPTLNEEHYLPKLLDSIVKQQYQGKLQIIIVDGNSADATISVANSFNEKINDLQVVEASRGIGHQRNEGAKKAKYKYLMFVDADIVLPRSYFLRLFKKINSDQRFIVSTIFWPADGSVIDWIILALAYPLIILIYHLSPTTPGALTLTTKENHEKVKGYKEGTIFGEDTDYGHRSVRDGAEPHIFYTPYIYHSVRRAREMGMIGLLLFWLKSYIHVKKHGVVYEGSSFKYPYGNYK